MCKGRKCEKSFRSITYNMTAQPELNASIVANGNGNMTILCCKHLLNIRHVSMHFK
jgi:hypothetical protein